MVASSSILRLQIKRGDFLFSESRFSASRSPPSDWALWVNDILVSLDLMGTLRDVHIMKVVVISRNLTIAHSEDAKHNLELLVSQWSLDSHTFSWAWGESGMSFEDVFVLLRLPVHGRRLFDPEALTSAEMQGVEALMKAFSEAKGDGSQFTRYGVR